MKIVIRLFALALPVLLLATCRQSPEITPQPPVITDQHMCSAACANLQTLKCEEGDPVDMKKKCAGSEDCVPGQYCLKGTCYVSCDDFCVDTQNAGVWLDPTCVSRIQSCKEIEMCPVPQKKLFHVTRSQRFARLSEGSSYRIFVTECNGQGQSFG